MSGHYEGVDVEKGVPVYIRTADALSKYDSDIIRRVRHAITVGRLRIRGDPSPRGSTSGAADLG